MLVITENSHRRSHTQGITGAGIMDTLGPIVKQIGAKVLAVAGEKFGEQAGKTG